MIIRQLTSLFLLLLVFVFSYSASHPEVYGYKILRIIDGDTLEIEANFLPEELGKKLHVRIAGINTPEKGRFAGCSEENMLSLKAKLFVEQEVYKAKDRGILLYGWDKYGGRVLGDVYLDGVLLSKIMLDSGYADKYEGSGPKTDWCKKLK